jgi:hypothetical protein
MVLVPADPSDVVPRFAVFGQTLNAPASGKPGFDPLGNPRISRRILIVLVTIRPENHLSDST